MGRAQALGLLRSPPPTLAAVRGQALTEEERKEVLTWILVVVFFNQREARDPVHPSATRLAENLGSLPEPLAAS